MIDAGCFRIKRPILSLYRSVTYTRRHGTGFDRARGYRNFHLQGAPCCNVVHQKKNAVILPRPFPSTLLLILLLFYYPIVNAKAISAMSNSSPAFATVTANDHSAGVTVTNIVLILFSGIVAIAKTLIRYRTTKIATLETLAIFLALVSHASSLTYGCRSSDSLHRH